MTLLLVDADGGGPSAFVCATCSEHFTRRYSATRHNLTIHNGIGEIVTYIEYLVGRNSGRYRPSHPSLFRRRRHGEKGIHNVGHATTVVADSTGDTFRHRGLQQGQYHHYPQYQEQAQSPSIPQQATQEGSHSQPMTTTKDHGALSQETMLKIQELTRLVYSNHLYCPDPDAYIKSIICLCNDGHNSFLDEKLEELRMISNIVK